MGITTEQFQEMKRRTDKARGLLRDLPPSEPFEGRESELHDQIQAELKRRRWYYVHSRTDKRTTQELGTPDFIIAVPINGKTIWMEVKRKGGKLTPEQNAVRHVLTASLHIHRVVYSIKEVIEIFDWNEL